MNKILYHPRPGTTGFFLMENVPELLNTDDFEGGGSPQESYYERYDLEIRKCEEEAIKNGEIVNPLLIPTLKQGINKPGYFLDGVILCSGDTFDFPEGLTVVIEEEKYMTNPPRPTGHKRIRLSKKEEKEPVK